MALDEKCNGCDNLKLNGTCPKYAGIPDSSNCGQFITRRADVAGRAELESLDEAISKRAMELEDLYDNVPSDTHDWKKLVIAAHKSNLVSRRGIPAAIRFIRSLGSNEVEVTCVECGISLYIDSITHQPKCPDCWGEVTLTSLL